MHTFRFPIATLFYVKNGFDMDWIVEHAREWALVDKGDKRPSLTATQAWINKVIEDDRTRTEQELENA